MNCRRIKALNTLQSQNPSPKKEKTSQLKYVSDIFIDFDLISKQSIIFAHELKMIWFIEVYTNSHS